MIAVIDVYSRKIVGWGISNSMSAQWGKNVLQDVISSHGKGRSLDNVWIERFWKYLKYDYVYLNAVDDGFELYEGVQSHIDYYHDKVHHSTSQSPNIRYEQSIQRAA